MRVIETFVTSVPRENIPADAEWFMQDKDCGAVVYQIGGTPPKISQNGHLIFTDVKCDIRCYDIFPVASDAAETVVTREELMRAYDLVEQGYTLWFGGECPVGEDVVIDVIREDGHHLVVCKPEYMIWGYGSDIIAYRLSRSVDKDVAAANRVANARDAAPLVEPVIDKPKRRLELLDKLTDGVWPGEADEQFLITEDGKQLFIFEPEKVITRAQWDGYVSRKIRVGDKVKTYNTGSTVEVLFLTDKTALVRYPEGTETSVALSALTRIPQ